MSRSIDLFINGADSLDDLAADLTRLTGLPFVSVPDAPAWVMRDGDVVAELATHPYVNDRDMMLKKYPYCLSAKLRDGNQTLDGTSPEAASLRKVAGVINQTSHLNGLLIWDLQLYVDHPDPRTCPEPPPLPEAGDGRLATAPVEEAAT
jgi:hypothetical protein